MAKHANIFDPKRTGYEQFKGQVLGHDNARQLTDEEVEEGLKFYGNPEKPEEQQPAAQPAQVESSEEQSKQDNSKEQPQGTGEATNATAPEPTPEPETTPGANATSAESAEANPNGNQPQNAAATGEADAGKTSADDKSKEAGTTGEAPQNPDGEDGKDGNSTEEPIKPASPKVHSEPAGGNDGQAYSEMAGANDYMPSPTRSNGPIRSSANVNLVPFEPGLKITADVLNAAGRIIAYAHDYGQYGSCLINIAINAMASSDDYVSEVLAEAKNRPQVKISERDRFYDLERPNVFYDSFAAAKKSLGDVSILESCGVNFDFLIGSEKWYFADGVPVQPVSEGEPEVPKPKYRISSHLLRSFPTLLAEIHDCEAMPQDAELFAFFKHIVLMDDRYVELMRQFAELRRKAQRRKMVLGFWVFDPRCPSKTKSEAEQVAIDKFIEDNPLLARKIMRGHGSIECGKTAGLPPVKRSVYYATKLGLPGEPASAEEAKDFLDDLRKRGYIK